MLSFSKHISPFSVLPCRVPFLTSFHGKRGSAPCLLPEIIMRCACSCGAPQAAGLVKKEVTDIKDMAAAIKSMPQYKELVSKYSLHMDLTRKCMGAYEARGLELVSTQEQNIATGSDAQGKTVKNQQQLVQSVLENLQPSEEDKMRLLLIWAMQDGVTESDLEPMLHAAKLTGRHQQTIQNLELLNVVMQKKGTRPSFFKSKTHKPTKTQDGAYDLARYRPPLEQVMHAFCEGKLSGEEYPYTSPPPSTKGIGPISSRLGQSVRTVTSPKMPSILYIYVVRGWHL